MCLVERNDSTTSLVREDSEGLGGSSFTPSHQPPPPTNNVCIHGISLCKQYYCYILMLAYFVHGPGVSLGRFQGRPVGTLL